MKTMKENYDTISAQLSSIMETLNETLSKPTHGSSTDNTESYSNAVQRKISELRKTSNVSVEKVVSHGGDQAEGTSAVTTELEETTDQRNTDGEDEFGEPKPRSPTVRRGSRYFVDKDGFNHKIPRKRNSAVIGKGKTNSLRVAVVTKKKDVFVSRLHEDTTCEEIKNHVIAVTKDDSSQVVKLQNKHPGYSSFRITCDEQYLSLLTSEDNWEEGILLDHSM